MYFLQTWGGVKLQLIKVIGSFLLIKHSSIGLYYVINVMESYP